MSPEEFTEVIVKSIVGDVPDKIYNDGFSPVTKQLGKALGTLGEVFNSAIYPIKFGVEEVKLFQKKQELRRYNNLLKYANKLKLIPKENIVEVPTEILIPVVERFSYTSKEELVNAFINLLTRASSKDTRDMAHPSFIHIIDRISSDEARILDYLGNNNNFLVLVSGEHKTVVKTTGDLTNEKSLYRLALILTDIDKYTSLIFKADKELKDKVNLDFHNKTDFYFENLLSLGLIEFVESYSDSEMKYIDKVVEETKNSYNPTQYEKGNEMKGNERIEYHSRFYTSFESYKLTIYGDLFVKTCIE
ncbi:DUF4393 domain-containing protein [uncultured Polaribacter sp.]|uniref:DUF4393 domain-containing protein n=1 Tax=uncultured Polaribacter sp. TaxID=174711 RepID=UPI00259AEE68|nr:DUF4393 domain-containing protein [uncultured Polaribacter sp.]